jgi:DNA uptake protein ComE-like DNA-binding protein
MGLESATYIDGLVETNPTSSDNANQGDNHLRLIKAAIKATFPNITGPVTATHTALSAAYLPLAGGTVSGPITASGGVVGNASTATALQTARTINGVAFNGTANISFNADNVAEGTTNKYFTTALARAAISAAGDLSYNPTTGVISFSATGAPVISVAGKTGSVTLNTADVAESTNLYFTNARARSAISVSGAGSYNSTTGVITINAGTVSSVAGKTGAVTLAIADISGLQTALDGKYSASGGTISGNVSVSGTVTATGDITAFSDERTKTNVETITEALYKVKAMRGVSYISKFNMEERIGVIAQEVERVVPEVVHTHENGLKSVAYQNLVGLLIEAIKALELRVAELESR